jgi:hypothetical protein
LITELLAQISLNPKSPATIQIHQDFTLLHSVRESIRTRNSCNTACHTYSPPNGDFPHIAITLLISNFHSSKTHVILIKLPHQFSPPMLISKSFPCTSNSLIKTLSVPLLQLPFTRRTRELCFETSKPKYFHQFPFQRL